MSDINENVYVYACRYAYNRQTGAAKQIVNILTSVWSGLSVKTRSTILKESEHEAFYNKSDWRRLKRLKTND